MLAHMSAPKIYVRILMRPMRLTVVVQFAASDDLLRHLTTEDELRHADEVAPGGQEVATAIGELRPLDALKVERLDLMKGELDLEAVPECLPRLACRSRLERLERLQYRSKFVRESFATAERSGSSTPRKQSMQAQTVYC